MIKNILLGYNGSRGAQVALSQAVDLARPAKARLHVTTIEPLPAGDSQVALHTEAYTDGMGAAPAEPVPLAAPEEPQPAPAAELEDIAEICRREEVFCTFNHHYGDPAQRLLQLARVANLLVVARRDEPRPGQAHAAGRTARHLAAHPVIPTLFAGREHLPVKSATLLYEPRAGGGRALTLAGEICMLLNISLHVMSLPSAEVSAEAAEEEARFTLRAYHLDGEFTRANAAVPGALQNAAMSWNDPLIFFAAPPRQLLFNNTEAMRVALGLPNTNILLVP